MQVDQNSNKRLIQLTASMEAMTVSIAIILSLISTITAAPQNLPSNMVLGVDLDTGSGYPDIDDKIINRRRKTLCVQYAILCV